MAAVNPSRAAPRINFNSAATINVNRTMKLERNISRAMEQISSGMRVNRPADDVVGHSVSERLRGQIRCMNTASRNIQDGMALMNIAEGALHEVTDALQRIRELATQAANGAITNEDRQYIHVEVQKLKEEIDYISRTTQYNGKNLLDGTSEWGHTDGGNLQMNASEAVGYNNIVYLESEGRYVHMESNPNYNNDYFRYTIPTMNTETLGIDGGKLDVLTQENAMAAIDTAMDAVNRVSEMRSGLGSVTKRLEEAWRHTEKVVEDTQGHESVIRDTDMAEAVMNLTRDQILHQYCNAVLAQANQTPAQILQLLRG